MLERMVARQAHLYGIIEGFVASKGAKDPAFEAEIRARYNEVTDWINGKFE
jgi:hypothetical protein